MAVYFGSIFLCFLVLVFLISIFIFRSGGDVFTWLFGFFCSIIITCIMFWGGGQDYGPEYEQKEMVEVFSTSSPTKETSFSFGFFSHNTNNPYVSYLIRTKVEGGYKDVILKDIVLNEDSEFINKGKFVSIETCRDWSFQRNFFFFWTHKFDGVYTDCTSVSRILTLPVGSIRQVLSI